MQSLGTAEHSSQRVAHCKVIVIVGMEVKVETRITLEHLTKVFYYLKRVHNTQGIRQHESFYFSSA